MTIKNTGPATSVASGPSTNGVVEIPTKAAARKARSKKITTDPTKVPGPWVIPDDTRRALEKCELFRDFTRTQLMQVAALVEERSVQADETLLVEGDPARHVMIVVEGQAVA